MGESGTGPHAVDALSKPADFNSSRSRSLVFGLACAALVLALLYWLADTYSPCAGQCHAPYIFTVDFPAGTPQSEISAAMAKCTTSNGEVTVGSSVTKMYGPYFSLADLNPPTVKRLQNCLQVSGAHGGLPS